MAQAVKRARTRNILPFSAWRAFAKSAIPIHLKAKEVLFHVEDEGDGCYLVRSGAMKATVVSKDGQERLLAIFSSGALIGELALVDDLPRSATVTALRPCRLSHLTKSAFFQLADAHPAVYRYALRLLSQRLRGTNQSVLAQGTVTAAGRVARAFTSLVAGLGEESDDGRIVLTHKITQSDIAAMAGVARENASRAINDFLREGILGRDGGYYTIERPDELYDMADV